MPNWCHQRLTVAGNRTQLRRFVKDITVAKETSDPAGELVDEEYNMNRLVPLDPRTTVTEKIVYYKGPDGDTRERETTRFAEKEADGFDGYMHAVERWGTKWGACNVSLISEKSDYPIEMHFESAWSPAIPLLSELSKQYPGIAFAVSFTEESMAFGGFYVISNGEVIYGNRINTDNMPPELQKLWDELQEAENDPESDEEVLYGLSEDYEEARMEWHNTLYENLHTEATTCLGEFLVWNKKAERQRKAGRFVESFLPSV